MKYSIIIPIYNVEEYLEKCLASIQNQSINDFEVLCINDGTKDNSQQIVDQFVNDDCRFISYIKENGGLADARNYGIDKAKGEYLLFVDSDDYVTNDWLEVIDDNIDNNDVLIFGYNQLDLVNNTSEVIVSKYNENELYTINNQPSIINNIDNAAWNKCYRRSLFEEIRFPVGYLYEDLGTTYRLLDNAKSIKFVNKPLLNYLQNRPGNITTMISDKLYDIFDMCSINIRYFKEKQEFEKYYYQLENLCWSNIVENLRKLKFSDDKAFVMEYIDSAFDYINFQFPDKKHRIIAKNKSDLVYEYRMLCKLYMIIKGGK